MPAKPIAVTLLRDTQHGGSTTQAGQVAAELAEFVAAAKTSIDVAIYDFRLSDPALVTTVVGALTKAADAGVAVRIAYDAGKPTTADHLTFALMGADPAPPGTSQWVDQHFGGTKVQIKGITAPSGQLMHSKYIARDAAAKSSRSAIWTGSTNFTDDAWTRQENNIVTVSSAQVATGYSLDFEQLWKAGSIRQTGSGDGGRVDLGPASLGWDFAPGGGSTIDAGLAAAVRAATDHVVIASMVLTSRTVLDALAQAVAREISISGIYDGGQMDPIERQWEKSENSASVLADWRTVKPHLAVKQSTPYTPDGPHDFMHDKILVTDGRLATGSYNFSGNAEKNAENQLQIAEDDELVREYTTYIAQIAAAYAPAASGHH
ncbi:MAG: hypothetical protein JO147_14665 [Actinobacteria bacterium]|nr:hypothetical protein [Actinomycetota bacterium]